MPETGPPLVEVRELAKAYGRIEAVRGLSFNVAAGEIFGLLGRNGAGKTTTLECLLGLRTPDHGTVRIDGIDARLEPERARGVVGAQLQDAALQDQLTPRQALRFFGSFYRRSLSAEALLERFALTGQADAPFHALSGGQRQRLFLALAFVQQPRVVVLDEPTAGLDPQARRALHEAIRSVRSAGAAVLLSTHYLAEAEQLCDRVAIIDQGRLVALGTPAELVARVRRRPALIVRTVRPLVPHQVATLPGVVDVRPQDDGVLLECTYLNHALIAVVQHLAGTDNTLVDLQIRRPSLEDAFVELTGEPWSEAPMAGKVRNE